jgi:hypothetical protein
MPDSSPLCGRRAMTAVFVLLITVGPKAGTQLRSHIVTIAFSKSPPPRTIAR